jgi:hypothetical protein
MSRESPSRLSVPLEAPEDVIRHLAKGVAHWKGGYSAYSLAKSWFCANDFPPRVRSLLDTSEIFRDAAFLEGFFERKTDLGMAAGPARPISSRWQDCVTIFASSG